MAYTVYADHYSVKSFKEFRRAVAYATQYQRWINAYFQHREDAGMEVTIAIPGQKFKYRVGPND